MIDKSEKLNILKKIKKSDKFKNSPSSKTLLSYLVDKSIEGAFLKEGIINLELYGEKNEDAEKSTPRVRVKVYHLRKKLEAYYLEEGKSDPWKLVIKKGQYNVTYESKTKKNFFTNFKTKLLLPYLLLILLLTILFFYLLPKNKPNIWKAFFDSEKRTNLYIGDNYGFIGKTITGGEGWIQDFTIHNLSDYYKLIQEKPELKTKIKPAHFHHVNRSFLSSTKDLGIWFANFDSSFEMKFSSNSIYSDLKNNNLIYIGAPTKKKFVTMFNQSNTYCKIKNNFFVVKDHPVVKDASLYFHTSAFSDYEYAIVSRLTGPENTEQFYFFSKHEIGIMSSVEFFTNKDSIQSFEKKYLKGKTNFTALYKVYGNERINMKSEQIMVLPF